MHVLTSTSQKFAVHTFCVFVGSAPAWMRSAERKAAMTARGFIVPRPVMRAAMPEPRPNMFIGPRYRASGARTMKKRMYAQRLEGTTASRMGSRTSLTFGWVTDRKRMPMPTMRMTAGPASVIPS